jgi:hypothetical protein
MIKSYMTSLLHDIGAVKLDGRGRRYLLIVEIARVCAASLCRAASGTTLCCNTEDQVYRANTSRDVGQRMEERADREHNSCDTREVFWTSASACPNIRSMMKTALCGRKTSRTFDETLPLFHVLCDLHPLSSLQKVNLTTNPIRLLLHPCFGKQALTELGDLH